MVFGRGCLLFNFSASEPQKLSGWNFALIIVGVILFVVGVCVAIALAVLLTQRIKAGCKWSTLPLYYTLCALQLELEIRIRSVEPRAVN